MSTSEYLSIDQVIAALQAQKDAGIPGDSPAFIPSTDNNGRSGFLQRVSSVGTASVAKADFDKGWSICKGVSNRGVQVTVIR